VSVRASVPETRIARTSVQQVDLGEVRVGPASVGRLVLSQVRLGMSTGSIELRNLRVILALAIRLDWQVSVTIPFVGTFGWSGTIDVGTISIPFSFGNVGLTGLQSMNVDIASVSASNLTATIAPLANLRLGPLVAEQIRARNLVAPQPPFQLTGLGLVRLRGEGVGVPGATVEEVTIARSTAAAFPLPSATIPGVNVPQTGVGQLTSNAVNVNATANAYVFPADAGVLDVTLRLTPSARTQIDQLRLNNVAGSASIGTIELQDVILPVEVLNLKLSQLGIETLELPALEVS
jgi:hypothetical protein